MNDSWVKVYFSRDLYRSELVKQFLVDNEIDAVLLNKQGYPYNTLGDAEVYVSLQQSQKALELITKNEL